MKAAVLEKFGEPLIIKDLATPDTLDIGQVLVKVHYSSICGAQIGEISGAKGPDKYLPHLLGHEGGGVVEKIGPGVRNVKPGNKVVLHWRKGRGIDANPPKYKDAENNIIGGGWVTTFNEYAVVSENRLTVIDDNVPLDIAALMGCAVTTGLGIVNNEAKLKFGQSMAIIGCGGVGLTVIMGAKLASASRITGVDINDDALSYALKMGANELLYDIRGAQKQFDAVVECTGIPEVINDALDAVKPGGKLILVGQPAYDKEVCFKSFRKHYNNKTITDSQGGCTNPNEDIPRYIELYKARILELDKLITHRFKLDEINEAIATVKSGKAGRIILEML